MASSEQPRRGKQPLCPDCDEPVYVNQSVHKDERGWFHHRNCQMPPPRIILARGPTPILPREGGRG